MNVATSPSLLGWNYDELRAMMPAFLELYASRPLKDNVGGMRAPHMFALYCLLKKLKPKVVVESGVWHGQGTWLIENTLPGVQMFCIDLDLSARQYISKSATYFDQDFQSIDWNRLSNKEEVLLFFDDHQDAVRRIKHGKELGFRNFIFEDNYPAGRGDCYSLKKAFLCAGNEAPGNAPLRTFVKGVLGIRNGKAVRPNSRDAEYLHANLSVYDEFPPVFKSEITRWGDAWTEQKYPTPEPILKHINGSGFDVFEADSVHYTWMCFAKLK